MFLPNEASTRSTVDDSQHSSVLISDDPGDIVDSQPTIHSGGGSLKLNAAKFLLKTKEECKLTQASLDAIVSGVKGLWAQAMDDIKQKYRRYYQKPATYLMIRFSQLPHLRVLKPSISRRSSTGRTSATL